MSNVVNTLWNFCHTLRQDGIDYGDYIEQITYLLFLKMADEREITLPEGCDWQTLRSLDGINLIDAYTDVLRTLGRQRGILGGIFSEAQSRFTKPVNLKQLLAKIDETEWTSLEVDVKAEAFEGLLEKAASEGKKGAGQYFTPRPLIRVIARCMKPDPRDHPEFTVCDPACGTGGFLVEAYLWLKQETRGAFDRATAARIRMKTYHGQELVQRPRRLALMNLYLHNLEPIIDRHDSIYDTPLRRDYDVILTNPPFGTKGAGQLPDREDFTIETANKQLNFLQHILTLLREGGRAAVVLPDNCLFADQAGEVFEILMADCNVHTVLRLPRGTFSPYSPGTQTNVIFFQKGPRTETTWIYDCRTNTPSFTKKDRPLTEGAFAAFERCYGPNPNGLSPRRPSDSAEDRWRSFTLEQMRERDYKLDSLKWLRDESLESGDEMPEPAELATDAIGELEAAVEELNLILRLLDNGVSEEQSSLAEQLPA